MAPPAAPAAQKPQASSRASSSSSSAADPNTKGTHTKAAGRGGGGGGVGSGAAASALPDPSLSLNGGAGRSPLLPTSQPQLRAPPPLNPASHPQPHLGAPPPLLRPPVPLPPSRPLLTVAAVEAVMDAIPPPPRYGLEDLDRRTVALSDGTMRTYFALPLEPPPQLRQPPPPLPAHLLVPPPPPPLPPCLGPDRWALSPLVPPAHVPAAALFPTPVMKRKWEVQANGGTPGEYSGRQPPLLLKPNERPAAKQVKVEVPMVDARVLKSAFLKMVKVINENEADKKNLRANGKLSQLKCFVCQRDSIDLHALLNHAYHAQNPEHRADHLGLHKALCVLMGWNYSVAPVHKNAYQSLSAGDAEANQGDLILWPPTVIVENTYKSKNDGQKDGMTNSEMESKLREMGFAGIDVRPIEQTGVAVQPTVIHVN